MPDWKSTTLGEFLSLQRGHDLAQRERRPGNVPVVGSGGVTGFHDTAIVAGPGITIGRAANLGVPTLIQEDFWPLNTTLYVTDFHGNDVRFAYYLLRTLDLTGFNSGSVQPMLNRNYIRDFPITVPSTKEQQAIVAVLRALDDKIAVNERIALTGEELILALASSERWPSMVPLSEIAVIKRNQISPDSVRAELVAHFSLPAFDEGRLPEMTHPGTIKSGKFVVAQPSVLLSKLNPSIPRVWNVDPEQGTLCLASTEFMVLVPKEGVSSSDLWAVAMQPEFMGDLAGMATGTSNSHQRVKPSDLLSARIVDPREIPGEIRKSIADISGRCRQARYESRALAELRDTLLPKLMSGQVRVREAEKVVEEAVLWTAGCRRRGGSTSSWSGSPSLGGRPGSARRSPRGPGSGSPGMS